MKSAPLKEEWVFREVFKHELVRKQFISDVVGIPIEDMKAIRLTSTFLRKQGKRQKQGILDLLLILNDDTKIDIELQLRPQKFWVKTNLFYLSHMYVDDLLIGQNYDKLKRCITISILDFKLLEGQECHSVYTMRNPQGGELTNLLEMHFIELRKDLQGESPIHDWICLFNAQSKEDLAMLKHKSAGLNEAVEAIEVLSLSRSLRWMFNQHLKAKRDRWAEDEYVRDQGRAEARKSYATELICRNKQLGRSVSEIAEILGEDSESVQKIYDTVK